ncbi:MAG: hypothetical protein EPO65_04085 [Dehalococcoidia bacterium]|nr:MAG: hypothetical protein EPO65_04085 [Dehalococcoidia bacterium]
MSEGHEAGQEMAGRSGPRVATGPLVVYGASLFVSGLFVLASAGSGYSPLVYAWIALFACAVAFPIAGVGILAALVERMTGRMWLSGARRLEAADRGARPTIGRGARYASWIWLANGLALWIATIASQFPA